MSLLSRKEIRVALFPDKLTVLALSKGLSVKVLAQSITSLSPDSNLADWRPSLQALEQWMAGADLGNCDVKVQLSNVFVRYAMLPFDESVHSEAERLTLAGLQLESTYGEAAKQWRISLDEIRYGEPSLVAAIDAALAESIEQLAARFQCKIASIQPYSASVINAFGKQIDCDSGLLVIYELGGAIVFDIRQGEIGGVRKVSLGKDAGKEAMEGMLRRELLMSGLAGEAAKIYLHAARDGGFRLSKIARLDIVELQFGELVKRFGVGYEMLGLDVM